MRNKTRTLLTILGVVIGISSVIAMVSLGQSSQKNINNQVSTMGTNMIMVMPMVDTWLLMFFCELCPRLTIAITRRDANHHTPVW
jgi:hypothetical protein